MRMRKLQCKTRGVPARCAHMRASAGAQRQAPAHWPQRSRLLDQASCCDGGTGGSPVGRDERPVRHSAPLPAQVALHLQRSTAIATGERSWPLLRHVHALRKALAAPRPTAGRRPCGAQQLRQAVTLVWVGKGCSLVLYSAQAPMPRYAPFMSPYGSPGGSFPLVV